MRAKLSFVALLLVSAVVASPSRAAGSKEEAAIRAEVSAVAKAFVEACERVDVEAAMKFVADVPDFLYADPDGSIYDRASLRELMTRSFAGASSQKITTLRERFIVLGPDVVLWSWNGGVDVVRKSGPPVRIQPYSASFVLRRIAGRWQIVYQHESAVIPSLPPAARRTRK